MMESHTKSNYWKEYAVNVALWVVQGLLAAVYLAAGVIKTSRPRASLAEMLPWTEDLSDGTVKLIGSAELLGAIGLVLPWAIGIATVLTPLAATGLVVIQVLACVTHVRRGEAKVLPLNIVLLLLALFVAIGRFAG